LELDKLEYEVKSGPKWIQYIVQAQSMNKYMREISTEGQEKATDNLQAAFSFAFH